MPCPTCDHTMQNIGATGQRIFWCSRCGTLKSETNPEHSDIDVPIWVKRFCVSRVELPHSLTTNMAVVVTPQESTQLARRVLISHVDGFEAEVDMPRGWILAKGKTRLGDKYLDDKKIRSGTVKWLPVSRHHLRRTVHGQKNYYIWASAFSCLIRLARKVS